MKDWFKRFLAVDNSINEQSVMGLYWSVNATLLMLTKVIMPTRVDIELVATALLASLLCFGISGFKRV